MFEGRLHPRVYQALLALIVVIGCARIAATYRVFCETMDEPVHLAAGMEWLDRGTYHEDASHPPLARVLSALWPYASGLRSIKSRFAVMDGNYVLFANDNYLSNLAHARAGILPLYIAAVLIVASWTRRIWGDTGALIAAFLLSNEPNILAHSGLTTTDMAAATVTVAVAYAFWRFLYDPGRGVALGIALGLGVLAKFSTLLFIPVALAAILAVYIRSDVLRAPKRFVLPALSAAAIAVVIVVLGYRVHDLRELFAGIGMVRDHARAGHIAYFFGEFRQFGWWYYFPVAIALKSTIAFLILLAIGCWCTRGRDQIAPLAAGAAILLSVLPATINIGVRHILPVYPFFAVVAAGAVVTYRRIGLALCAIAFVASLAAHPDYLPYFNFIAGQHPDRIFVDSNLDWGQDLLRLKKELKRRNIESVALAYAGNAEPDRQKIASKTLWPLRYTPGWAAISEMLVHSDGPEYRWLSHFNPVMEAGKSIRLYYLPTYEQLAGAKPVVPLTKVTRTPLLLPVWFEGTFRGANAWTCNLTVENDGGTPITLEAPSPLRIAPSTTITNPNFGIRDGLEGAVLNVKTEDADRLHFALTIRSASGQTVAMPVIRERDLRANEVRFPSVPINDAAAATLRIYDLTGESKLVRVRLIEPDGAMTDAVLELRQREGTLTSTSIALNRLFPGRNLRSAKIVVDPPSGSFWTCVTVSDTVTNQAYLIVPD